LLYDWSVNVAASPADHRLEMSNKLAQPTVIAEFLEKLLNEIRRSADGHEGHALNPDTRSALSCSVLYRDVFSKAQILV